MRSLKGWKATTMLRRAAVRYVRGDTAESSRLIVSQICCENDVSVPAQSDIWHRVYSGGHAGPPLLASHVDIAELPANNLGGRPTGAIR